MVLRCSGHRLRFSGVTDQVRERAREGRWIVARDKRVRRRRSLDDFAKAGVIGENAWYAQRHGFDSREPERLALRGKDDGVGGQQQTHQAIVVHNRSNFDLFGKVVCVDGVPDIAFQRTFTDEKEFGLQPKSIPEDCYRLDQRGVPFNRVETGRCDGQEGSVSPIDSSIGGSGARAGQSGEVDAIMDDVRRCDPEVTGVGIGDAVRHRNPAICGTENDFLQCRCYPIAQAFRRTCCVSRAVDRGHHCGLGTDAPGEPSIEVAIVKVPPEEVVAVCLAQRPQRPSSLRGAGHRGHIEVMDRDPGLFKIGAVIVGQTIKCRYRDRESAFVHGRQKVDEQALGATAFSQRVDNAQDLGTRLAHPTRRSAKSSAMSTGDKNRMAGLRPSEVRPIRARMSPRPYQICTRCVMDTSDPLVTFDELGQCNLCTNFLEKRLPVITATRESGPTIDEMMALVRERGRGRDYDCVIGVSGGVDSSYTAVLAAEHGLRILAVHMDNGWNSVTAVANVRNLVQILNLDYVTTVLPWKEFRQVQLAFLKASVPEAETPTDIAIQRAVHHHGLEHGVRTVLSGGNIATEGILPASWHYNARDMRYAHAILDAANCPRRYFESQRYGLREEAYYKVVRGIKTLYPLNAIHYTRQGARDRLEKDFGWQYYGSKHGESGYTKFIQTFYLYVKHGIDYRRATFCSEILLGKVTREEALAILDTPPFAQEAFDLEIDYVAKKLQVPRFEMDAIVALPPKFFFDYPNNAKRLGRIYDLYRWWMGKPKASNF